MFTEMKFDLQKFDWGKNFVVLCSTAATTFRIAWQEQRITMPELLLLRPNLLTISVRVGKRRPSEFQNFMAH